MLIFDIIKDEKDRKHDSSIFLSENLINIIDFQENKTF